MANLQKCDVCNGYFENLAKLEDHVRLFHKPKPRGPRMKRPATENVKAVVKKPRKTRLQKKADDDIQDEKDTKPVNVKFFNDKETDTISNIKQPRKRRKKEEIIQKGAGLVGKLGKSWLMDNSVKGQSKKSKSFSRWI